MDLYFVLNSFLRYGECFFQESIPFAVVGTDKEHQVNGNKVLGRKTKWGIIEGESEDIVCYELLVTSNILFWMLVSPPGFLTCFTRSIVGWPRWKPMLIFSVKSNCVMMADRLHRARLLWFMLFNTAIKWCVSKVQMKQNSWMSSWTCLCILFISVENIAHCEFAHLRDLLIR